jgi:hypothetical protein
VELSLRSREPLCLEQWIECRAVDGRLAAFHPVTVVLILALARPRVRHDRSTLRARIAQRPHQWQRQAYTDHRDFPYCLVH